MKMVSIAFTPRRVLKPSGYISSSLQRHPKPFLGIKPTMSVNIETRASSIRKFFLCYRYLVSCTVITFFDMLFSWMKPPTVVRYIIAKIIGKTLRKYWNITFRTRTLKYSKCKRVI